MLYRLVLEPSVEPGDPRLDQLIELVSATTDLDAKTLRQRLESTPQWLLDGEALPELERYYNLLRHQVALHFSTRMVMVGEATSLQRGARELLSRFQQVMKAPKDKRGVSLVVDPPMSQSDPRRAKLTQLVADATQIAPATLWTRLDDHPAWLLATRRHGDMETFASLLDDLDLGRLVLMPCDGKELLDLTEPISRLQRRLRAQEQEVSVVEAEESDEYSPRAYSFTMTGVKALSQEEVASAMQAEGSDEYNPMSYSFTMTGAKAITPPPQSLTGTLPSLPPLTPEPPPQPPPIPMQVRAPTPIPIFSPDDLMTPGPLPETRSAVEIPRPHPPRAAPLRAVPIPPLDFTPIPQRTPRRRLFQNARVRSVSPTRVLAVIGGITVLVSGLLVWSHLATQPARAAPESGGVPAIAGTLFNQAPYDLREAGKGTAVVYLWRPQRGSHLKAMSALASLTERYSTVSIVAACLADELHARRLLDKYRFPIKALCVSRAEAARMLLPFRDSSYLVVHRGKVIHQATAETDLEAELSEILDRLVRE